MFKYYFKPLTLDECIEVADYYGDDARFLAGGTDLVPKMRSGILKPKAVIDLSFIPELDRTGIGENEIIIGAMRRLTDISRDTQRLAGAGVICAGAGHVSSIQVRNSATIGGNSCNASPSADTVPCLIVSEAEALIGGVNGEKSIPVEELFTGPGKTRLGRSEILTAFRVPLEKGFAGSSYEKFSVRGDSDIAIVGVAGKLVLDENGIVQKARLAMAAVAPVPFRAEEVERMLTGEKLTSILIDEAAYKAYQIVKPISDQRATKEYRREMIRVHTRKVLEQSYNEAMKFLR